MSEAHDPGGKVRLPLRPGVRGRAAFSQCGRYRHWLSRWWGPQDGATVPFVLWIGMNPSTAEAEVDDPTIRKEMHFTRAMGYSVYIKCNVMDYRATYPQELIAIYKRPFSAQTPALCTLDNLGAISQWGQKAAVVIAAWGALPSPLRGYWREAAAVINKPLMCMGITKNGSPRHPLYLRNDAVPTVWREAL